MQETARARRMSLSVRKLHLITQMLPGMNVDDALTQLQFMASPWAKEVAKVVRAAAANAENNYDLDPSMLRIARMDIGPAETLRRYKPRARGQAGKHFRKHSNLTVIVDDEENG
ncbi:MAG: 50S ribosomal protein L22 [Chloroflexi bacterium]|nr:50S ribosomal protein L22 [Chloroflexota bacterium]